MSPWTTETPDVEGWYFWRKNGRETDSLHWQALYFEADIEYNQKGQWAGPITLPGEQE